MTTKAAIRTIVRDRLNETSAGAWSNDTLDRFINDAVRDIARRTMSLQADEVIAVSSGDTELTLPTDLIRVSHATLHTPDVSTDQDPIKLEFVSPQSAARNYGSSGTGTPRLYSTWGVTPSVKMKLYPATDADCEVKVYYYRIAADAAVGAGGDATAIDVANGWDDLVVDGAEWRALRRDRDDRWREAKSLYEQSIEEAIESLAAHAEEIGFIETQFGQQPRWLTDWA